MKEKIAFPANIFHENNSDRDRGVTYRQMSGRLSQYIISVKKQKFLHIRISELVGFVVCVYM